MNNKKRTWYFEVHDSYSFPSDVVFTSPHYETKESLNDAVDEYNQINGINNTFTQLRLCSKPI